MNISDREDSTLSAKLDIHLTRLVPFGFAGALLVAKQGHVLLNQGYGFADRSAGIQNTADTVFSLGSVTKQFTAAAIMKLEMMGRLRAEDPVARYVAVPQDKRKITLHHLLTHTAGLINYTGDDFEMATREEALGEMLSAPLRFDPGEQYEYSNAGYSLLAAVVESVSEAAYEEFLRKHLFEPAQIDATGYRLPDWEDKVVARWYVDARDNGTPLEKPYPSWNLMGNGDMLSTTPDMYRWHLALQGEQVLSAEAKRKLYQPFLNKYAYGWQVTNTPHGMLVEHGGASSYGTTAHFSRYLDAGVVIVLFSNALNNGQFPVSPIQKRVKTLLFDGEVELPPMVQLENGKDLKQFEGMRELRGGGQVRLTAAEGRVNVTPLEEEAVLSLFGTDVHYHQALARQTLAILAAAREGNYRPLEEVLADKEVRLSGVRALVKGFLEGQRGPFKTVATVPSSFIQGALDTVVGAEGGDEQLLFIWKDQKNVGCGLLQGDPWQRLTVPCLPLGAELVGYHLGMGRRVQVPFSSD